MNLSPHVQAMIDRVDEADRPALEKAESLVEVAFDLQKQPRAPQDLFDALALYDRAADLAREHPLARARSLAGKGAALRRMPGTGLEELTSAQDAFIEALPILREAGEPEEVAEAELTYGLVLQALASSGKAPLPDAVQAYQRALRVFTSEAYPREFAVIHNNLATAYLSMRLAPDREVMREALAVQSFREALKVVTLQDDPSEYAMLQNNLGNALQALRSKHPTENLLRAIEAYDEALKVRTRYDTPVEFANTIANKANALMNLPDDPEHPDRGNPRNLREAAQLLHEADQLFRAHGLEDRAHMVQEVLESLAPDLPPEADA